MRCLAQSVIIKLIQSSRICAVPAALLAMQQACPAQAPAPGMEPGTCYREYTTVINEKSQQWRVTDPNTTYEDRTSGFLPNPVLEIPGVSLENAVRAELTIDFWSGHAGTRDKKIRFNGKRKWIPLEEQLHGAEIEPYHYYAQYNITVPVPLKDLVEGTNTVRGTCGDNSRGWGQWGWYALTLRVFVDDGIVDHPGHRIVQVESADAAAMPQFRIDGEAGRVRAVDYLAAYEGVDEDGDGDYRDYHGMYRYGSWTGHVGSTSSAPEPLVWDTEWIPDQRGPVTLGARIQMDNGDWHVLQPLENVRMNRRDYALEIIHPINRPTAFWVRNGRVNSCVIPLPLDFDTAGILDARMFLRTWNAENNEQGHTPFRINHGDWQANITGPGHRFHMEYYPVPAGDLRAGHNLFTFHSTTQHHGCELLWPGPQLLLKTNDKQGTGK